MALAIIRYGPFVWFFGGLFMILLQAPALCILFVLQIHDLITIIKTKEAVNWRLHTVPWLLFVILMSIWSLIEKKHLLDPFYNDHFSIEITLNPDYTCSVLFDGKVASTTLKYVYRVKDQTIDCLDEDSFGESVQIHFDRPSGQLIGLGSYSITSETPQFDLASGLFNSNGGAYFNNSLGGQYSPFLFGSVYWNFESGFIQIDSVSGQDGTLNIFNEKKPVLSGKVTTIASRHYSGL